MRRPLTTKYGQEMTPESERIPLRILTPLVNQWIKDYYAEHPDAERGSNMHSNNYVQSLRDEGVLAVLSFQTGVSSRTLRMIRQGKYESGDRRRDTFRHVDYAPFDIADRIVCGTVGPMAWQVEPLNEFYGPLTVKAYERTFIHEEVAA